MNEQTFLLLLVANTFAVTAIFVVFVNKKSVGVGSFTFGYTLTYEP